MNMFIGKYKGIFISKDGEPIVMFALNPKSSAPIEEELVKNSEYRISVSKPKDKRSIEQNKLMWELLGEISMHINGSRAGDEDLYAIALQMAGAKFIWSKMLVSDIPNAMENYRAVVPVQYNIEDNGSHTAMCKCFIGSSKMNTKEMSILIDKVIELAEGYGIDTDYYREEFNNVGQNKDN